MWALINELISHQETEDDIKVFSESSLNTKSGILLESIQLKRKEC